MGASRTGTTNYLRWASRVKHRARRDGVTHCPITGCGVWLDYNRGKRPNSAEADHITPDAIGGTLDVDNGRVICRRCNQQLGGALGNQRKNKQKGRTPQKVQNIDFRA